MADDTKNSDETTVKLSDVEKMINDAIAKRDKEHEAELASVRQMLPTLMVAANGGGPGTDNHQPSWNLAEQEAAAAGETLDHWS